MTIHPRRLLSGAAAVALAAAVGAIGAPSSASASAATPPSVPSSCADLPVAAGFGITCQSVADTPVSYTATVGGASVQVPAGTFVDVTMTSTAVFTVAPAGATPSISPVAEPITTRVWLPAGYDRNRPAGYQSLYLLHGGGDNYNDWQDKGHVVQNTAGGPYQGLYVMPTGGMAGWYSDWAGHTDGFFAPKWETFHVKQLVPWIDANFHTVADRSARAVAGPSMGGFGALRYAADHPEVFSAVGAFSPGTQLTSLWAQQTVSNSMWQAGASIDYLDALNGTYRVNKKAADGSIVSDQQQQLCYRLDSVAGAGTGHTADSCPTLGLDWPQANPTDRAAAGAYAPYSGKFALYAGACADATAAAADDGTATAPAGCGYPADNATDTSVPPFANSDLRLAADVAAFDQVLHAHGVVHRYCFGTGAHDWSAFDNDLADFLVYAYGSGPVARSCGTGA